MSKALSYRVAAHRLGLTSAELYSLVEHGDLNAERKFGEPPRIPIREITWFERRRDERRRHGPLAAVGSVVNRKVVSVVGYGVAH
jgi:hypothetical protein